MVKRDEQTREQARKNLNEIVEGSGLSVSAFARSLKRKGYEANQQTVRRYLIGENDISVKFATEVARVYGCQVSWLLGESEYRTHADEFESKIGEMMDESQLMFVAFFNLAKLNGVTVEVPFAEAEDVESVVESIKNEFATVSRDGVMVKLSMDDFYELQNQFVDYAGMRLERLLNRGKW